MHACGGLVPCHVVPHDFLVALCAVPPHASAKPPADADHNTDVTPTTEETLLQAHWFPCMPHASALSQAPYPRI